jgi:subtilase family serine protease
MTEHLFEDIYPGFNAEIKLYSKTKEFTYKTDIIVHAIKTKMSYSFTLLQKIDDDKVVLLDKDGNRICTLDNININDTAESIVQLVITTCISTIHMENNTTVEQQVLTAKPCYIHHFQNEMYPTAFTGFTPIQIRTAYNVRPEMSSNIIKGVITIVIAYCYPGLQRDFDTFCNLYKLPPTTLKIVTLDPNKKQDNGWAMEECLDVQWAYAMNPKATIQVVEARSNSFEDMFEAVKYASNPPPGSPLTVPHVISMSWGANESSIQVNYDKFFSNKSILYVAATGDNNFCCYPATSPHVLAVGGTSLAVNGKNQRVKETTWTSAGCGLSSIYLKPSYQSNTPTKFLKRIVPDVSGVANSSTGVVVIYKNRPSIVGGTSVSTPIVAGILSISSSKRSELKKAPFTTINNVSNNLQNILYPLYNNPASYGLNFYDVKLGYDGAFVATSGHDLATGLGVMNGQQITKTLINTIINLNKK